MVAVSGRQAEGRQGAANGTLISNGVADPNVKRLSRVTKLELFAKYTGIS